MRGGHAGVACVEGCLLGGLDCEWSIHSGIRKKLPILIQVSRNNTIQHSIHSMEHLSRTISNTPFFPFN